MAKPTDTDDTLGDFIKELETGENDPLGDFIEEIETGSPDLLGDFIESITPETDETAPKPESKPPTPKEAPPPPPQKPEQKAEKSPTNFAKAPDVNTAFKETETQPEGIKTGRKYYVPNNFAPVIRKITQDDPISGKLMVKILGSESNFDNNAVSSSGAFSAGQFVPTTFYERAWKSRDLLSPKHKAIVEANIEEYDRAKEQEAALAKAEGRDPKYVAPDPKWRIKSGGSEDTARALMENEYVVSVLAREHLRQALKGGTSRFRKLVSDRLEWLKNPKNPNRLPDNHPRIQHLQEHLERPMNFTDAKTFYLCGERGGAELLFAYAEPSNQGHRAKDYTTESVWKNNLPVFEKPDGTDMAVKEYIAYMHERVGNQPIAENLDRPEPQSYASLNL